MEKTVSVVTGANGFVGSHLVDHLISKNHTVKCITRKSSNLRWLENKPVEIVGCGLFNLTALENTVKDADYIFHIAGVVKAKTDEGYFSGNVETTKNILDSILSSNSKIKRVVIVSSFTACGPATIENPSTEETNPHPITRYGKSKLEQEKLTEKYMDKLPISIVRPPAVFGARDTEIYLVFKTFKVGLMTLIGFNKKLLSFIHVTDLVEGLLLVAESDTAKGKNYFISSDKYYDWNQIGDAIAKAMGKNAIRLRIPHFLVYIIAAIAQFFAMFSSKAATFNIEKARDFVQEAWTCDISKAKKELDFHPKISLEEGIKRTIDWYRDNNWL